MVETQLMASAEEKLERGFAEDELLVMPMPVFDDSSDDDSPRPAAPRVPPPPQPPPSAEYVERLLYGAKAHAHADRGLHDQTEFFAALRNEESGAFQIPLERQIAVLESCDISADAFEAEYQAAPCLVHGVPQTEGWPAAEQWASEAAFVSTLGDSLQLPITGAWEPCHRPTSDRIGSDRVGPDRTGSDRIGCKWDAAVEGWVAHWALRAGPCCGVDSMQEIPACHPQC